MALATRCPFCETVFRLDPHLLAPHDGRVRCGHCQEVFDSAHYQFERDETVMAALAATTPNYEQQPAPHPATPDYGNDANSPWASSSNAEVAGGNKTALGIPLHPFVPETALTPVDHLPEKHVAAFGAADAATRPPEGNFSFLAPASAEPPVQQDIPIDRSRAERLAAAFAAEQAAAARAREENDRRLEREALARRESEEALAAAQLRTEVTPAAETFSESDSPWDAAHHARADELAARGRTDPFIGRVDQDRIGDTRAEPFVNRTEPLAAPVPAEPVAPVAPADPWHADAEPRFGAPPTLDPAAALAEPQFGEPFPVTRETRPAVRSGALWKVIGAIVSLVLVVLLIGQLAWWQRESVMVYWPHSQSLFAQACEQIGCVVAPPRDIDALQIENSALRQVDGSHKLELKLSLRNRFDVTIAYPALELALLDDKNNVTIRRVLWPKEYARPGSVLTAGIPARTTLPVIVRLDTGDAVAANYRVQIFYP